MIVSDLIRYRNDVLAAVNQIDLSPAMLNIHTMLTQLEGSHPHGIGDNKIQQAKARFAELVVKSQEVNSDISSIVFDINNAIDQLSLELFPDTNIEFFHNYYGAFEFDISSEITSTVTANIHHNANFHFPALQLGCSEYSKQLTHELVANDPLYLCDFKSENVEDVAGQFNEIYYKRLRRYPIENHDLSQLPQNQFGFIFSWMLFNYTNLTCIQEYLKKTIALLRPGGRFLFSYNNCDILESCLLAEQRGMSYVSKRNLLKVCRDVGYEIVYEYDLPNNNSTVPYISWIEIKKPGELDTIKRRQVIGAIHQK